MRKIAAKLLLVIIMVGMLAGSLLYADPARAQLPVTVTSDIPATVSKIRDLIKDGFRNAVINIAVQSASYFLRRVAYDTAVYLASGGKGQSPLAHYKDFGSYMEDVGDNVFGVAVEALGAPYGLNLCKIPDPKIDLAMRIGLTKKFLDDNAGLNSQTDSEGVRKPDCTWNQFSTDVLSADNWKSQFGTEAGIDKKFNVAFSVEQTDIGIFMGATKKLDDYVAKVTEAAKLQREEGNGFKGVTGKIDGTIVTPGAIVAKTAEDAAPSEQTKMSWSIFGSTLGTGAVASIAGASSLFLNTLASQMLKNFQTKGMFPFGLCVGENGGDHCKNVQDVLTNLEGQVGRGGRLAAQALFSDLLTPPNIATDDYNILSNFTNCPSNPNPDNCVADAGLAQAAQESNSDKAITIADALEKNWLHGEWKLLSPERVAENVDPNCHQRAYCYANIAKLRKARILPLGFEIAALNSNPDKPWTLKDVVSGFNDCNFIYNNGQVVGVQNDPLKPFCHLIDPNWVIKAPLSKCNFMAYGATPSVVGTPNRTQECVDMTTCVAYDKNGNCATQGYCTREKNVWKIDAAKCDAENRTCRTFQDSTGKNVSYLYRTLDTGYCTQDTVGCTEYSLKQNIAGNWVGYSRSDLLDLGENSVIHFNKNVSTNCSANSDGCSSFQTAKNTDQLYLKKAPYYLGCYDVDPNTAAIDWPRTVSDLNRLAPTTTCSNYAQPCIADEVSCNWYSPVSYTGDNIPGKFTPAQILEDGVVWNDQCAEQCVGYAAYREMPSNYSNGQAVDYIIPSSGSSCNAVDEGCSSFTNLATTEGGLEKVEHFSYLRPCILPDTAKQKTFFTYEGSQVGGFQLKSFVLEKDSDGSPKYFYRTEADRASYDAVCSESLYQQHLASPDCRQFNDEAGAVYYKLLSKTVAVSQSCTPYRLNDTELYAVNLNPVQCAEQKGNWDGNSCQVCFQNGEYRDGQCFYSGLPGGAANTAGISKVCAASANSCRAYKGNAGNNVRNIFSDNFEGANVLAGWGPAASINQSLESTHNGEHSLSYSGNAGVYKNLSLTPGESYDIIFWAKGEAGDRDVTVVLENEQGAVLGTLGTIGVSDVWQSYHLGPVVLGGTESSVRLKFNINGRLFLDNINLKQIADYLYLIKNSLSVSPTCDSNINDNLPGEALGCSEYRNPSNQPLYLTKFTSLCREKAIGCTALYDTRNTPNDADSRAYNVWFRGQGGQKVINNIGGREYSCQVPVGQSGCYVDVAGANLTTTTISAGGGEIVTSTVYIPSDTVSSTPVYLVADREASCSAVDVGCTKAGKLTQTISGLPKYTTVLIKQDPATYPTTLCQHEAVGCGAYGSSDGALYFKDPSVIGQKVCAYRDNVSKNGVSYKGWFWKGVGKCSNNGNLCTVDSECGGGVGVTCGQRDEQPCYPEYLQSGNNYGLWSYGTTNTYKNFVGECPSSQSGCTEFIDHNESDKPYYIISDDSLKQRQAECSGQISEKSGCILLDRTDQPNKLWNTAASYAESAKFNSNLVTPIVSTTNDANFILKVNRDRECGEWLQCRSSHRVFDQQSGTYKEICDDIGRCNKAGEGSDGGIVNCANWIDGAGETSNNPLTDDIYRDRSTDWKGQDYSGLSLLNIFPIEELSEVNVGTTISPDWRLVKPLACGGIGGGENCKFANSNSPACQTNGLSCGRNSLGSTKGVCLGGTCVQNFDGSINNVNTQSIKSSCRAYPEETSPFPNTQLVGASLPYSSVNLCNETGDRITGDVTRAYNCECNYTKVSYGDSAIKYWNFTKPNELGIKDKNDALVTGIVSGLCLGGANDNKVCAKDDDCPSGTCQKKKNDSKLIGWEGYCVEPDLSRPLNAEQNKFACLTWFPKDTISDSFDINNQHTEAAFQAVSAAGKYYCLGAKGNALQPENNVAADRYRDELTNPVAGIDVKFDTEYWTNHTDATDDGSHNMTLIHDRKKVVFTPDQNQPIYRDELDYISFRVNGNGNWFPNANDMYFYIRNGLLTKYNETFTVIKKNGETVTNPQIFSGERAIGNRYVWADGRNKDAWVMRYDDGDLGNGDNTQYQFADPDGGSYVDLLRGPEGNGCTSIDTLLDGNRGGDNFQSGCLHEDINDTDDGCAIKINFASDGRLTQINFVCLTGEISGGDWEHANFRVIVGLKESCLNIAQTTANSSYDAVGWTNRLWEASKYTVNGLNYKYDLPANPFGSLGLPSELSAAEQSSMINIYTHYNNFDIFDYPPAVLGSPYSCQGNCLDTNIKNDAGQYSFAPGRNGLASSKTIAFAKNSLSQLFAKLSSVWSWLVDANGASYQRNTEVRPIDDQEDQNVNPYNVTDLASNQDKAPKVRPLGNCATGEKCLEGNLPGLTVNGKSSGNIIFPSNVGKVSLKFYGYADKDQMPIRKIKVDWGDSTIVDLDGYFRNARGAVDGQCNQGKCFIGQQDTGKACSTQTDCQYIDNCFPESTAPNFGQIANKTCDNNYFKFDHVYQCVRGDTDTGWKEGALCTNQDMRALYGGCCEFTPAVQLKDNWGWCNGRCEAGVDNGNGCYDGHEKLNGQDECAFNSAFTTSSVRVIIAPN